MKTGQGRDVEYMRNRFEGCQHRVVWKSGKLHVTINNVPVAGYNFATAEDAMTWLDLFTVWGDAWDQATANTSQYWRRPTGEPYFQWDCNHDIRVYPDTIPLLSNGWRVWSGKDWERNYTDGRPAIWNSLEEAQSYAELRFKAQEAEKTPARRKYGHYFRDVRHLRGLDIYRFLRLFEVIDPCLQHAIKKLVCAGRRGAKDSRKDIQEAIDSLQRWLEMDDEDKEALAAE